jgi:hypothetical protein
LEKVQIEVAAQTSTLVDLVRTPSRNLIRNSGQYWKAVGLLDTSRGKIKLTSFGRDVAEGNITLPEFAATVIAALELPNPVIQDDTETWKAAEIRFRPLDLILRILRELRERDGKQGYITGDELIRIVEPLSAQSPPIADFVDTLLAHRRGELSLDAWPDCAPAANDERMAVEFLLFLMHHGYCSRKPEGGRRLDKYYLAIQDYFSLKPSQTPFAIQSMPSVASAVLKTGLADLIERQRVVREVEVISRPNQSRFRREVLKAAQGKCVVTGTTLTTALEAAHIIPVNKNGSDAVTNGFCMRSDIHTLYDTGHIRISPEGAVHLSTAAESDNSYKALIRKLALPAYVEGKNVQWRWDYC